MRTTELMTPVQRRIYLVRNLQVMLDSDLAELYEVSTKAFNQAVKRNSKRFPKDFMLRLDAREAAVIRSQSVTGSKRNTRHRPYVFTEQGVAMLSGLLGSKRAIQVNIAIMRAFVQMRQALLSNRSLAGKLEELENKLINHDLRIEEVVEAIRALMRPPPTTPLPKIGYRV